MNELKDLIGNTWQTIVAEPTPITPGTATPQPPTTPKSIDEIRKLFGKAWQFLVEEPQPVNPATGPATGPATQPARLNWDPEDLSGKPADWVTAWRDIETRWTVIEGTLPTGSAPAVIETRFKTGMDLIRENILGTTPMPGSDKRAMVDYMLTKGVIWPTPVIMRKFFKDGQLNSIPSGLPKSGNLQDLSRITRDFFISPALETVITPNTAQKAQLRKVYRSMAFLFHPDKYLHDTEVSQNLKDVADDLFKSLSGSWDQLSDTL